MRLTALYGAALFALAVFSGPPAHAVAQQLDEKPRIAVVSAFEPEWQSLLALVEEPEEHMVTGRRFVTGVLEGKDVVLFLSGISMVNAAMTTQQAIDRFNVTTIVFSGIAGGVDSSLTIGDVVVSEQWGQYLEAVFARETDSKFDPPGFIETPFPNFGMIFPKNTEVLRDGLAKAEQRFWFPAEAELLEVARKVASGVTLNACAEASKCLTRAPKIVVGGNGVSGQAFVDNADFRTFVFETFNAQVLDMESAAAAHVAYSNEIPFIAFRSLSDLAGGGEGENEMGIFFALASANSAKVVRAFLAALP
jgi:adenosylhomocysteine nucleosidase